MATETAVADTATPRTKVKRDAPKPTGGTPWWMWLAVAAIVIFCLFPFYWLINLSLKTGAALGDSSLIPPNPTLDNYESIFKNADFILSLRNSAIISLTTTALALLVGSFCAYALARLRFRGKFGILALVLSITTFPAIAIAAPLFRLWSDIGIYNTLIGLIIPNLTFALPLAIYILTFIATWNEFLLAITLTSSTRARPVPAAIAFFTGSTQFEIPYGTITAASVTISVPLILLVLFFQKRIVAGLTAGAVKG